MKFIFGYLLVLVALASAVAVSDESSLAPRRTRLPKLKKCSDGKWRIHCNKAKPLASRSEDGEDLSPALPVANEEGQATTPSIEARNCRGDPGVGAVAATADDGDETGPDESVEAGLDERSEMTPPADGGNDSPASEGEWQNDEKENEADDSNDSDDENQDDSGDETGPGDNGGSVDQGDNAPNGTISARGDELKKFRDPPLKGYSNNGFVPNDFGPSGPMSKGDNTTGYKPGGDKPRKGHSKHGVKGPSRLGL
ncbi:hypothetical protein PG995_007739 [Apiospora arundinis]